MRASTAVAVVALCLVSGLVGWVAGRMTAGAPSPTDESPRTTTGDPSSPIDEPAERPRERRVRAAPAAQPEAGSEPPAAAGATVAHALPAPADAAVLEARLKELAGGVIDPRRVADAAAISRKLRAGSLAAADSSDQSALRQVADEIAKERAFLADQSRGGTMEMLRGLEKQRVRMFGLVGDQTAFAAHFVRKETGPAVDGPSWKPADGLAHGATLRFPAGLHSWSTRSFRNVKTFPRDLTIEGAGMNATLVRLDELSTDGDITNLTFRDCTIDCGDNYFTDLRTDAPITLRLERCRVIGFDMGAGGSVMLSADTAAFFATDCRFEAGYGRTQPGFGNLFRVREGLLVRCERSVFRGPFRSVYDEDDAATYVFADCRFERMERGFAKKLESPPAGVRFEGCTSTDEAESSSGLEKRPLSDFNAAWPSKAR
jgi:hypothetical protein